MTLEGDGGQRRTLWGVGLERALAEARPSIDDMIVLQTAGSETVRLPGGGTGERQEWKVSSARDAAWRQLESRLSRSGLKETTLDYALDFAERRGIAETLGVRSEIEIRARQASTAGSAEAAAGAGHPARAPEASEAGREGLAADRLDPITSDPFPQVGAEAADGEALAKALAWADKAADAALARLEQQEQKAREQAERAAREAQRKTEQEREQEPPRPRPRFGPGM